MRRVLILEPNLNQALAIAKYIKRYSNYYVIGCGNYKPKSNIYDEWISGNKIDFTESFDYVLPTGASSTFEYINKVKELKLNSEVKFTHENLIVFDKVKMLDFVKSLNIPVPHTFQEIRQIYSYPVFYKEKFEKGGGIRGIAYTPSDIPKNENLIYQEFIDTPSTYGVGFLANDGEILTYMIHKEVISYPKEGGSAIVIEQFFDERLISYTSKIIKHLNYNGWGLAEYKYCNRRKDFVFMELNAKFWASIEFMLINNPVFLKYILGINYHERNVQRILFINRLLSYNFMDSIKNCKYLINSKIIVEESLGRQILIKLIPTPIKSLLKGISIKLKK